MSFGPLELGLILVIVLVSLLILVCACVGAYVIVRRLVTAIERRIRR